MKKVGILTQPLHQNYGGLLQAYALQTVLKRMGKEPVIIDRHHPISPRWRRLASHVITFIYKSMGKKRAYAYWPTVKEKSVLNQHTDYFINRYIQPKSPKLYSTKELLTFVKSQSIGTYVVGSDQVWRPCYSPHLPTYFLDFVKDNKKVKKIAYAASFGVDTWEFSKSETRMARRLAPLFDAISVREDSGITLCEEFLGVKAQQVLDPTLLLTKEDYVALINKEKEPLSDGDLFVYVLDDTLAKTKIWKSVGKRLNLTPFRVQPLKKAIKQNVKKDIKQCVSPPVTKWLRAFMDAEFVVTDSFHGCVFSMLFNKPFLAIGNHGRGLARFNSLFSGFNLENRLIFEDSNSFEVDRVLQAKIDWIKINSSLKNKKEYSMNFIKENIHEE